MRFSILWVIALTLVVCAFALALSTCGGGSKNPPSIRSGGFQAAEDVGSLEAAPPTITSPHSFDEALGELDAYPCPEGVDEELWGELKDALGKGLSCRVRSRAAPTGDNAKTVDGGAQDPTLQGATHGVHKFVSTPPAGEGNRVDDLELIEDGGAFTLTWHYRNSGDYDQNGAVGISDITPIAMHYGETYEPTDENCIQAVVDGSCNYAVDIADITPIAMYYSTDCAGYRVQGQVAQGSWTDINSVSFSLAQTEPGRLHFSYDLGALAHNFYRVVPYDAYESGGVRSVIVPESVSQPPNILGLSPHGGTSGESVTFNATVEGPAPLSYAWDFGGGATPNTSTEASPTVTLGTPNTYSAALTATNAFGEDTYLFTLTVTEETTYSVSGHVEKDTGGGLQGATLTLTLGNHSATTNSSGDYTIAGVLNGSYTLTASSAGYWFTPPGRSITVNNANITNQDFEATAAAAETWVHTWGGSGNDYGYGVAVDGSGNVYVSGFTDSFGAGSFDVVLVKYDSSGSLLWQKTWGGSGYVYRCGVAVDGSGNVYVTGYTPSFGAGGLDVILLKYDSSGSLLWQKTWGGSDYDYGYGVAVDGSGNVYVTGETYSFGAGCYDIMLLQYDSSGSLLWQKTWGGGGYESGYGVAVDGSGNVYVTGWTNSYTVGFSGRDVILLKYDSSGSLLWQRTWRTSDWEWEFGSDVAVDGSGNVYVTGETTSFGGDAILLKYDCSGSLLWQKTWCGSDIESGNGVAVDASGNVYVTGETYSFGAGGWDVFLLKYDSSGSLLWQKTWGGSGYDYGYGIAVDGSGMLYLGGVAPNIYGSWQDASGTISTPSGSIGTPSGSISTPAGSEGSPNGSESSPDGVEDEGGGGRYDDLLVMKLDPSKL